jgi:hypothetical protein
MERMGQDSERAALEASLLKIIRKSKETGPDLQGKLGTPSAARTRELLLRRHSRPSAVQTSNDARHQRAEQAQAVAL